MVQKGVRFYLAIILVLTARAAFAIGEGVRVYYRNAPVWSASTVLQGTLHFTSGVTSGFVTRFGVNEKHDKRYDLFEGKNFRLALSAVQNRANRHSNARESLRSVKANGRAEIFSSGLIHSPDIAEQMLRFAYDPPRADPNTSQGEILTFAGSDFAVNDTGNGGLDTDFKAQVTNFTDQEISNVEVKVACAKKVEYSGVFFTPDGFKTCTLYQGQSHQVRDVKTFYEISLRVGLYNENVNQDNAAAFAYFDTSYKTVVRNREAVNDCSGTGKYVLVCGSKSYNYRP